jgi:hypothetical protein
LPGLFNNLLESIKMSWQSFLSVIAASIGFVSGIWFCYASALIRPEHIVKASDDSWDAEPGIDEALISQSSEYLAGGSLLVLAFGLQIAAVLAPTTKIEIQYQELLSGVVVVPVTVFSSALISYPVYKFRRKWLEQKVQLIKSKRTMIL